MMSPPEGSIPFSPSLLWSRKKVTLMLKSGAQLTMKENQPKAAKLEERKMHEIMWDEYWVLPFAGAIFYFVHTRAWRIASVIHYTVIYTIMILAQANLAYTTYLVRDRLSLVSQSLHLSICGLVAMTSSLALSFKRKKFDTFTRLFNHTYDMCEYAKNDFFEGLSRETSKRKTKLILVWSILCSFCGMMGPLQPVINSYYGTHFDVIQLNGVWMNLPFMMWCPWDLENNTVAWIAVFLFQGIYLGYGALIITAGVTIHINFIDRLSDQLELINYGIRNIDQRAKAMFKERYPARSWEKTQKEYDECFYECMKQSVIHHLTILEEMKLFEDILRVAVAVPFYGGAMMLGMSMIILTAKDDPRAGPKFMFAVVVLTEMTIMYLSAEIYTTLFQTSWYLRSVKTQKAIMMMRYGCFRPIKYKAFLLVLNVRLFSEMVNSGYSIFNLSAASS